MGVGIRRKLWLYGLLFYAKMAYDVQFIQSLNSRQLLLFILN